MMGLAGTDPFAAGIHRTIGSCAALPAGEPGTCEWAKGAPNEKNRFAAHNVAVRLKLRMVIANSLYKFIVNEASTPAAKAETRFI
jgi:hypothetical protein